MVRNRVTKSVLCSLALAASNLFSGTNEVIGVTSKVKEPSIYSFNIVSSNSVSYVQIEGIAGSKSLKDYKLQVNTSLSSNSWQDVCYLDEISDKKKEKFYYSEPATNQSKYFRIRQE